MIARERHMRKKEDERYSKIETCVYVCEGKRERERCLLHGDSRLTRCEAYVELFNDVSPDSESCLIAPRRIEFMHV